MSPFYMVYKPQPIQLEFADNNEEKRELRWFPTILVKRIQMHSSPSDAFFENKEASVASLYLPPKMGYFTSTTYIVANMITAQTFPATLALGSNNVCI